MKEASTHMAFTDGFLVLMIKETGLLNTTIGY